MAAVLIAGPTAAGAGALTLRDGGGEAVLQVAADARLQMAFDRECSCAASADPSRPLGVAGKRLSGAVDLGVGTLSISVTQGDTAAGELALFNRTLRLSAGEGLYAARELGAFSVVDRLGAPDFEITDLTCEGAQGRARLSFDAELVRTENPVTGPHDPADTRRLSGEVVLPVQPLGSCGG